MDDDPELRFNENTIQGDYAENCQRHRHNLKNKLKEKPQEQDQQWIVLLDILFFSEPMHDD